MKGCGRGRVLLSADQPRVFPLPCVYSASSLTACSGVESSTAAPQKLLILDARSYTAAVANRAKGGGCECEGIAVTSASAASLGAGALGAVCAWKEPNKLGLGSGLRLLAVIVPKLLNLSEFSFPICKMGMDHPSQSCWMIRGYMYTVPGTEQLLFVEDLLSLVVTSHTQVSLSLVLLFPLLVYGT